MTHRLIKLTYNCLNEICLEFENEYFSMSSSSSALNKARLLFLIEQERIQVRSVFRVDKKKKKKEKQHYPIFEPCRIIISVPHSRVYIAFFSLL